MMNNIQSFERFVNEDKTIYNYTTSVQIDATKKKVSYTPLIHHFTTYDSLVKILKSNTLQYGDAYDDGVAAVSLTNNVNLPNTLEDIDLTCRISLDKEKLAKKYTLIPYLYIPKEKDFSWECKDEMEEQVREDIKKLANYIIQIDIIGKPKDVKKLQELYPKLVINKVKDFK